MNIDRRASDRMGCSKAFHQTKDNWKDNGTHSLSRNNGHHGDPTGIDSG